MGDKIINNMKMEFDARSVNEAFARTAVAAFAAQADPSVAVITDIKTVVSEAVTNAIVHGYASRDDKSDCPIYIYCKLNDKNRLTIKIKDTTDTDGERSGMGFTIMQSFTDGIKVKSRLGKGTVVTLEKRLNGR